MRRGAVGNAARSHRIIFNLCRIFDIRLDANILFVASLLNSLKSQVIIIDKLCYKNILLFLLHRTKQDKNVEIPSPPGYTPTGSFLHSVEYMRESDSNHLIIKKSWDLALGPLKQVPMNLFIMYMAGSSISIFPIIMVSMLIVRPVKALFTLQQSEYSKVLNFIFEITAYIFFFFFQHSK